VGSGGVCEQVVGGAAGGAVMEVVRCPKCGSEAVHVVPNMFLTVICYKCGKVSFVFPENE